MRIRMRHLIAKPVTSVWQVLAHEFSDIQKWHPVVKLSHELPNVERMPQAPTAGRVCVLASELGDLEVWEHVSRCDPESFRLDFDVELRKTPTAFPVRSSRASFQLFSRGAGATEVHFAVAPELKLHGYLLYPFLVAVLKYEFRRLLANMQLHVESR